MPHQFSALTFTPSVQRVQDEMGSRLAGDRLTERGPQNDTLTASERTFLAARDSFYMATVSETGWPYMQHRGGPTGFLHVLDDHTLAFADTTGNRQYISAGNLRANDRACLFLMDYPNQTRLKVLAHTETLPWSSAPGWKSQLLLPERTRPERVLLFHIAAFDWNCPQHITPRWTSDELAASPLADRLRGLEAENSRLRDALANAPR